MTTETTAAAPQNTEQQLVGQTFTLWLWPYFCLREEAWPVEIMHQEKDRTPGVMFLESDEMPNITLCVKGQDESIKRITR